MTPGQTDQLTNSRFFGVVSTHGSPSGASPSSLNLPHGVSMRLSDLLETLNNTTSETNHERDVAVDITPPTTTLVTFCRQLSSGNSRDADADVPMKPTRPTSVGWALVQSDFRLNEDSHL